MIISLSAYYYKNSRGVQALKASTFNLHSLKIKSKPIISNKQIIVLVILFFTGLVFGSFSIKNQESVLIKRIILTYMNYIKSKQSLNEITVFFKTMLLSSSVIIFSYFIGLCAIGIPLIILIPFSTGAFLGIVSGYIYETYTLKGLGYCGIIIFPAAVLIVASILFSCKESMLMSKNMLNLLSQRHNDKYEDFRKYSTKFLIYIIISCFGSFLEAILSHLFIRLFAF